MNGTTHTRESTFHDQWAGSVDLERIAVRGAFESPTALENRFIVRQMGELRGRRLLDVGCGLGESSVYFALRGAAVTATDISPGMIDVATRLARRHGVALDGLVGAGEELRLPHDHFDLAYVANTLHHVADRDQLLRQLQQALKPGGRVFFWDPLAYNPVINVYRRMATAVRTADESPLTFADVRRVRHYFVNVRHREFWLLSLALFLKYYFVDRIHPNQQRYWKLIYAETPRRLWWWRPLAGLDAALTRVPLLRRLAWNIVICGEKPVPAAGPGKPHG